LRKEAAICVVRGAISPDRQHHLGKPRSRMDQRTLARDLRNMVFADTAAGQGELSVAKLKHVSITIVVACAAVMEIRFIVIFDWRSGSTQYDAMCCSLLGCEVLNLQLSAPSPARHDLRLSSRLSTAAGEAAIASRDHAMCPRTRSHWPETDERSQP
jgi:hypothetical protein